MSELRERVVANRRPYSEVALIKALRAFERVREPGEWDLNCAWLAGEVGLPLRTTARALERLIVLGEVEMTEPRGWTSWYPANGVEVPRADRTYRLAS